MYLYMVFFGLKSEAKQALEILENFVDNSEVFGWGLFEESNSTTFMDWHGPTTDKVGSETYISSRLVQTENIDSEEARRETTKAIAMTGTGMFHLTAGRGVMDADASKTSVLPAWRKTVTHYLATIRITEEPDREYWSELAKEAERRI